LSIKPVDGRENKYLTFSLYGEEYGISILRIKEIIAEDVVTSQLAAA
jgi:chemotaxis signal transduction protein